MSKSGGSFSLRSSQTFGVNCSFPKTPVMPIQEVETSFTDADQPAIEVTQEKSHPRTKIIIHRTDPPILIPLEVGFLLRNHLITKSSGTEFYYSYIEK